MKFFAAAGFALFVVSSSIGQTIHGRGGITLPTPPPVNADPVTDNYSGTRVVDNYRWLEDAKSTATRDFIDAENAFTNRYMKQARIRQQVVDDLTELENVSAADRPLQRGEIYFF
jgi:prolyl oligopeptidase